MLSLIIAILISQVHPSDCPFPVAQLSSNKTYDSVALDDVEINGTDLKLTVWSDLSAGEANFSVDIYDVDAAFRAEWHNAGDFLARAGYAWKTDDKYYWEYGNVFAEYAYNREECVRVEGGSKCVDSSVAGHYSYIGVYGWSKNPLVEYYIVDDWFGNEWTSDKVNVQMSTICNDLFSTGGACKVGEITVDGAGYDVYKTLRINKPSIIGDTDFVQYWSVRKDPRRCGTIPVTAHFKEWESLGLFLGKMYEAKLLVEAGGGDGYIDYTYATLHTDSDVCGANSDDHYEPASGGSSCALRACADRRKNSLNPLEPCGPSCYWDMGSTTNRTKCIEPGTPCTDGANYQKKENNLTCEFKPLCVQRQPDGTKAKPCALDGDTEPCYQDVGGADPDRCVGECSHPNHIGDSSTGRCSLVPCKDRTPIIHALPGGEAFPPDYVKRDVSVTVTDVTFYAQYKCDVIVQITIGQVAKNSSSSDDGCHPSDAGVANPVGFPDEPALVWENVAVADLTASVLVYWGDAKAIFGTASLPAETSDSAQAPTRVTAQNTISWGGDGDVIDVAMNVVVLRTVQPCAERHPAIGGSGSGSDSGSGSGSSSVTCASSYDAAANCVPYKTYACFVEGTPEIIEGACGSSTEVPPCLRSGENCTFSQEPEEPEEPEESEEREKPSASIRNRRACMSMTALLWIIICFFSLW